MVPETYEALSRVLAEQLAVFPEHQSYLERRFKNEDEQGLRFADDLARMIEQVCRGHLTTICTDYQWLSRVVIEEEIHFRREGRYRLRTFEEAIDQVYGNAPYMSRYMNGLLTSQLWWRNHTDVMRWFRDAFLAGLPEGFSHLEVGPGHGLFLALAASSPRCRSAEGWDISDSSIANTREALNAMGLGGERVVLRKVNLFEAPDATFDSITFSEVLEHLEDPLSSLVALHRRLKPGGRIFVNAPVNSPAPDHLYLFRAAEEVPTMMQEAGFVVLDTLFAPCTGATLERARRLNLTVSAAVIATK